MASIAHESQQPTLSLGNRIYLYGVLSRHLGVGKQTFMPQVEEALAAERMGADDLGFSDTRTLLEAMGDCVQLTIFKGGRVYATLVAQPAWDEALAAAHAKQASDNAKAGGKSWKRKKTNKELKPVRPRRVKRPKPVEEPEEVAAAEDAAATTANADAAKPASDAPEAAPTPNASDPSRAANDAKERADSARIETTAAGLAITIEIEPADADATIAQDASGAQTSNAPVTDVPAQNADAPNTSDAADSAVSDVAEAAGSFSDAPRPAPEEHTPSISFTILYDPTADEEDANDTADTVAETISPDAAPKSQAASDSPVATAPTPEQEAASASASAASASAASASAASAPAAEATPAPEETTSPAPAPSAVVPAELDASVATPSPAASSTEAATHAAETPRAISNTPANHQVAQPAPTSAIAAADAPAVQPQPVAAAAPASTPAPLPDYTDFPVDFALEVYCPNNLLAALAQLLPYGADVLGILGAYFDIAKLRGTVEGTRSRVTFPMGYIEDGKRHEALVTIKRKNEHGLSWAVAAIEQD